MKKLILEVWEAIKLIPGWFEDEEIEMETNIEEIED